MHSTAHIFLGVILLFLPHSLLAAQPEPAALSFQDGDRVVWLGGTFIERMQEHNYLETWLTARHPERHVVHRNLGWSGDTPAGLARAVFGTPEEGFQRLIQDVRAAQPTVLIINYGAVEAHAGEPGLSSFLKDMRQLLDQLQPLEARIIILAPLQAEQLPPPYPDVRPYNAKLQLYTDSLRQLAGEGGHTFVDLNAVLPVGTAAKDDHELTSNSIHLTRYGYWRLALALAERQTIRPRDWQVRLNVADEQHAAQGTTLSDVQWHDKGVQFVALDDHLPFPSPPSDAAPRAQMLHSAGILRIQGLPEGAYRLSIDGQEIISLRSERWAQGITLPQRGGSERLEQLRAEIKQKNELYFHRYRPQNETYLFLFRKHEQGNNAVEVPQFDPLIAEAEQRIAQLRMPQEHTYTIEHVQLP